MSHKKLQQNISRLMVLLLAFVLVLSAAPMVRADGESGSCGDNLTWSLSAGTLTISGSGAMTDFPESTMAPWYPYRNEILRLELPGGLTRIGELAFYDCKNLTAVVIPDSVTTIGRFAFTNCEDLQLLSIGKGVKTIGEAAFSDCYSIQSLDLPTGLNHIGTKGFYRCESITTVTVPSSVTSMGVSVFAYCDNLVSAEVKASITTLPEYTFYGCTRLASVILPDATEDISSFSFRGCEQLDTVYYGGSSKSLSEIQTSIGSEVPEFGAAGTVTSDTPSGGAVTSGSLYQNQDGTITQDNVTVNSGENSSVSTKVEYTYQPDGTEVGTDAEITVNINGGAGWDEAGKVIETELENAADKAENVTVNVYVKDTDEIDSDFIDSLAGKPADVTVTTQNGSVWKVDASQMNKEDTSGKYNLSYTLTAGTQELCDELGTSTGFFLTFAESAEVNSEVMIRLGNAWAYQNATLFQKDEDGFTRIQSVVVDLQGYAHFYLAAVDKETQYCIGMNVVLPEEADPPIVPAVMQAEYGDVVNYQPIQYEITGRTSRWGMSLGQVMSILAAVMVSVIVVVGVVMYIWNKRRLKNGYVPDWDDDYE